MGVPAISTEKKSIGEVCKLQKRGRETIGKKSKWRGEKIPTESESLKEKKAVDCICDIPWMAAGKQQSEVQYQEVHTVREPRVDPDIHVGTPLHIFKTRMKTQGGWTVLYNEILLEEGLQLSLQRENKQPSSLHW